MLEICYFRLQTLKKLIYDLIAVIKTYYLKLPKIINKYK